MPPLKIVARRYTLTTLGRLSLADDAGVEDHTLATRPRKLALLTWLLMRPGRRASRDQLAAVFWAERDEERARNSLSDAISHLRRVLGRDAIRTVGNEILVDEALDLSVDAEDLLAAAKAEDHARVVAQYRGPFLDGFYVGDAPAFDDWRDRERSRFARVFAASAAARCERCHAPARGANVALWRNDGSTPNRNQSARRSCCCA